MNIRTTAALVAALLATTGCTPEEQQSTDAVLSTFGLTTSVTPPDYTTGSLQVAEIIEQAEPEPLRQIDGSGPMGEELWTGPGCTPVFRLRICK